MKTQIIGIGGAGKNVIDYLHRKNKQQTNLLIIDTDEVNLKSAPNEIKKFVIGKNITKGLGTGAKPEIGYKASEADKSKLASLINGEIVFLIFGLGGGTGTGASKTIINILKEKRIPSIIFVFYPFKFEKNKVKIAHNYLNYLIKNTEMVVVLNNDIMSEYFKSKKIIEAMNIFNEFIGDIIFNIFESLEGYTLMKPSILELKNFIKNSKLSYISLAEARGKLKSEEVVDRLFNNIFLDKELLKSARKVYLHFTIGEDLTIKEFYKIWERITENFLNLEQNLISVKIDPTYTNKIKIFGIFGGIYK